MPTGAQNSNLPEQQGDLSETLNGVFKLLARRRWWILITAGLTPLVAIVILFALPNKYTSEATLVAIQPMISQRLVAPVASTGAAEAFQAMTRQLLSRARLLAVIKTSNLYPKQRAQGASPEGLVELMRSNINVETLDPIRARNDFNTFKLVFTTDDPRRAQQATRQLADLFINEHVKTLEQQASSTTDFLTRQVEDARRKLTEEEQRLRDFKTRYGGELPEQQQSNFQTLMDFRMQLQTTRTALVQARMQRTSLASSAQTILTRLQFERTNLLNRLTPRHPDVLKKDLEVANVQTVVDELENGGARFGKTTERNPGGCGPRAIESASRDEHRQ